MLSTLSWNFYQTKINITSWRKCLLVLCCLSLELSMWRLIDNQCWQSMFFNPPPPYITAWHMLNKSAYIMLSRVWCKAYSLTSSKKWPVSRKQPVFKSFLICFLNGYLKSILLSVEQAVPMYTSLLLWRANRQTYKTIQYWNRQNSNN